MTKPTKPNRRKHRVMVEVTFDVPVEKKHAVAVVEGAIRRGNLADPQYENGVRFCNDAKVQYVTAKDGERVTLAEKLKGY